MFFSVLCLLCLCACLFICALWCITVSLSLSHWYPGSDVVLDCIDSLSMHPYLLSLIVQYIIWEHSVLVVECVTCDQGFGGLSLTSATVLCLEQDTFILAYYWFNPGRPIPT